MTKATAKRAGSGKPARKAVRPPKCRKPAAVVGAPTSEDRDAVAIARLQADPLPWFGVRNWREFQHYGTRNPPWIKVYVGLLDNRDFGRMTPLAQILLVKLWLLASRNDGRIELDVSWLGQRTQLPADNAHYLEAIRAGFLMPLNEAARDWIGGAMNGLDTPHASNMLPARAITVLGATDRKTDRVFLSSDTLSVVSDVVAYLDGTPAPQGRGAPRQAVTS